MSPLEGKTIHSHSRSGKDCISIALDEAPLALQESLLFSAATDPSLRIRVIRGHSSPSGSFAELAGQRS